MTESEFVQRVRELARSRGATLDPGDIRDSLPDVLKSVARMSLTADWRQLLENDYALTIVGRTASFAAQTDLLPDGIKVCDHITHSSVVSPGTAIPLPFRILDKVSDLDFATAVTQTLFAFAAIGVSAVEFRYSSTLTGTLNVRSVRIPRVNASTFVIENLPTQLDGILIETGVLTSVQKAAA